MKNEITRILIAGEGGQGIQTIAKVLASALIKTGQTVSYIPQFGPEQRGTPSVAFIQFGSTNINYPKFDVADIVIVLRKRALPVAQKYIGKNTQVIFDSSTIKRILIQQDNSKVFGAPATKLAKEKFGAKNLNILVLGVLAKNFLDFPKNALWQVVEENLALKFKSKPEIKAKAKEALEYAYTTDLENKKFSKAEFDVANNIVVKKSSERTAAIIPKLCKGCGICIEKCPVKALSFGENLGVYGTATPDIDIEKCITCGNCQRFCPDSAIKVEKS